MKKRKSFGSERNLLRDANEMILVERKSAHWICSDTPLNAQQKKYQQTNEKYLKFE